MKRRHDPDRRERIIRATYESISLRGLKGTTNRVVAAMSDVPLGSITYHFSTTDEMLLEAFSRYVGDVKDAVAQRLPAGLTREDAIEAIVALIHDDFQSRNIDYRVNYELYTLASRDERFGELVKDMTAAGHLALSRYFGDTRAKVMNDFIEGASTHLALNSNPMSVDETRHVVRLLAHDVTLQSEIDPSLGTPSAEH